MTSAFMTSINVNGEYFTFCFLWDNNKGKAEENVKNAILLGSLIRGLNFDFTKKFKQTTYLISVLIPIYVTKKNNFILVLINKELKFDV